MTMKSGKAKAALATNTKAKKRKSPTEEKDLKKKKKSPPKQESESEAEEDSGAASASGSGSDSGSEDEASDMEVDQVQETKVKAAKSEKDKKEDRKKQKKLKEERVKKAKTESVYELGQEAKKLWEKVRREDCPEEEKNKLMNELHQNVKGNIKKLIFAHDTVRVVECLMALGSEEVRAALFAELKDDIIPMAKSKYAYFFVVKMLKYGSKEQRKIIFKAFEGKVADLMKHKIANNAVEMFYNEIANAHQRNAMLQEFCGPEFRHFKEPELRTVAELIKKHPQKEKDIVRHLQAYCTTLIVKGCYNHSLVHTVIYNYLQVCKPSDRSEMIEQLRDVCLHVLHSHDGSRLSMLALWHGTPKDRKAIIKSFKGHVLKICCEKQGYMVMLAIFDSVDDTKIVGKAIVGEIIENMKAIVENDSGRKVLMYLMSDRNTTYFHPQIIDILKQGDNNQHTKKPFSTRAGELRATLSPPLVKYVVTNLSNMMFVNAESIFLTCVLNHADGSKPALEQLAEEACKPFAKDVDQNLVESTAGHLMLKRVIAHDKVRYAADQESPVLVSKILLNAMDDDSLECWVTCNRGAFLFVIMIETEIPEVVEAVKAKLKTLKKTIARQKTKGAEVLKKKLE